MADATIELTSDDPRRQAGTAIVVPDGTRWYPLAAWRLDGEGDVVLDRAQAKGRVVDGTADDAWLVTTMAGEGHVAKGQFVQRDGQRATQLSLPAGTSISRECRSDGPSEPPRQCSTEPSAVGVRINASEGTRLEVNGRPEGGQVGNGEGAVEVEVAGAARAVALGRTWTGLTGSLEGRDVNATAVRNGSGWTLSASARSARQLWVDVWPVVDTTLEAHAEFRPSYRTYPLRLEYGNAGASTAKIFEVVAVGGRRPVDLGVNATGTHDAGLGVHRGGGMVNVGKGDIIDSHLPPGDSHDRGLSYRYADPVELVIRGNFPEVRVTLPLPAGRV